MLWNWHYPNWPDFRWDPKQIATAEELSCPVLVLKKST